MNTAVVEVDYHQFHLIDGDESPIAENPKNGLVEVFPAAAIVHTGISVGVVNVEVAALSSAPEPALDAWDEVIDVSLSAPLGLLRVFALLGRTPDLPILTAHGPGSYRLRVHARGRDTAIDLAAEVPVEDYLIQVWAASPDVERIHKQTDKYGAQLRSLAGA
ncbi:MAG: hypothetical protein H0U53_07380 [Actinobacteria bacterium]|nr:hypothetical protein [Actinomycetota bacterium]